MNAIEAADVIVNTMEGAGVPLTEDQSMLLSGALSVCWLRAGHAAKETRPLPSVEEFAQRIRWLNGSNKMGAATLAAGLLDWLKLRQSTLRESKA